MPKFRRLLGWIGVRGDDGLTNWGRWWCARRYRRTFCRALTAAEMDALKARMRDRWVAENDTEYGEKSSADTSEY